MDLDSDGTTDLISGSWPGEIFFFKGLGDGEYADPVMLEHTDGKAINVRGGVKKQEDGSLLITGSAEFKDGHVIYQGKKYGNSDVQVAVTGCAAHAHAIDWDADGDFDLIIGDIRGNIYYIPNEGDLKFGPQQELDMRVAGDAGPICVDWNGDGNFDIVTGDDSGAVSLFINHGKNGSPEFDRRTILIPELDGPRYGEAPEHVVRGGRTKVWATDWNKDGKLDLLVGDCTYQKAPPVKRSPKEQAEYEKAKDKLSDVQMKWGKIIRQLHGPDRIKDKKKLADLQVQIAALHQQMSELRKIVPDETETHGWLWYFEQI